MLKMPQLTDLLGPIEAEIFSLNKIVTKVYMCVCGGGGRTGWCAEESGDNDAYNALSSKIAYITKHIVGRTTKHNMLPCTGAKKKTKFYTKIFLDGKIFGSDEEMDIMRYFLYRPGSNLSIGKCCRY